MRRLPRVAQRRDFVFHKRVIVQCQQIAEARQSPVEIEGGPPVAGIIAASHSIDGGKQRLFRRSQSDREIRASPHPGAAHAELEIRRRLEVDLESVDHGLPRKRTAYRRNQAHIAVKGLHKVVSIQSAYPEFPSERPQILEQIRKLLWCALVNPKHVDGGRVDVPEERVRGWAEKQVL